MTGGAALSFSSIYSWPALFQASSTPLQGPCLLLGLSAKICRPQPQNCMRGAMAMAISSWNSSLHAYGMCTCEGKLAISPSAEPHPVHV